MEKHLKMYSLWLCLLLLGGCVTIPPPPAVSLKPYIDHAIWSNTTKDKAYDACLMALQMEGFKIPPLPTTSKESGLIIPYKIVGFTYGIPEQYIYYRLQILVAEIQDNKAMVDIQVSVNANLPSSRDDNTLHYVESMMNNKVSEDLERFFNRMDLILGKAESRRADAFLKWE